MLRFEDTPRWRQSQHLGQACLIQSLSTLLTPAHSSRSWGSAYERAGSGVVCVCVGNRPGGWGLGAPSVEGLTLPSFALPFPQFLGGQGVTSLTVLSQVF